MSDCRFEAFKKSYPFPAEIIEKRNKGELLSKIEYAQLPRAEEAWNAFERGWNAAQALNRKNERWEQSASEVPFP